MLDLTKLYREGFAPGPREDERLFQKRMKEVKRVIEDPISIAGELKINSPIFENLAPSLICIRSSNRLPFWFGAMTWILEINESCFIPILQLPNKSRFSWIKEEEIIAHEKIHAMRAAFNSPRFEEIIAYQTSKSKWRRFLGPLFQSSRESSLFILFSLLALLTGINSLFFLPLAIFTAFTFTRLIVNQSIFHRAKRHLPQNFPIELLTDSEIYQIACSKKYKVIDQSLRWKLIRDLLTREE